MIVPAPLRPDTVGGYVQWRAYGFFAIVFAIWALASGVGSSRGDEERGLVEATLAAGVSRADALIARFAAFTVSVVVAAAAGAAGVYAGIDRVHDWIDPGSVAAASVLLLGLALACYALTLLVCQLTPARMATAVAGAVLLVLFLVNSLGRSLEPSGHAGVERSHRPAAGFVLYRFCPLPVLSFTGFVLYRFYPLYCFS